MKVKNNFSFYSTPKLLIKIKKNWLQYLQPGMGEMENIGNIEIKNYQISFWNCEIDIDKYHIKILLLILVKPV
jgi:hypothetical protein